MELISTVEELTRESPLLLRAAMAPTTSAPHCPRSSRDPERMKSGEIPARASDQYVNAMNANAQKMIDVLRGIGIVI